jgi:hypothetical protein
MPSLLQAVFWQTARLVGDISMSHQWDFYLVAVARKDKPKRYVAGDMMNDFHQLDSNLVLLVDYLCGTNHRQQPLEAWTKAGGASMTQSWCFGLFTFEQAGSTRAKPVT